MLSKVSLNETSDALKELAPLQLAFPILVKVFQIALTISVTSAKCERSFSALKRIKTYLRSTMSDQRLTDLAILSIERDLSDNLDLDEVLDCFSEQYRRIVLK